MTSDPNHEGDHADHGQHHGEGDGGVCGDGVEKQVDYGRHGKKEAPASATDQNWNETTEQTNNRQELGFSTLVFHVSFIFTICFTPRVLDYLKFQSRYALMIQTSPNPQFSLKEASVTANRTTDLDGSADRNITQAGASSQSAPARIRPGTRDGSAESSSIW